MEKIGYTHVCASLPLPQEWSKEYIKIAVFFDGEPPANPKFFIGRPLVNTAVDDMSKKEQSEEHIRIRLPNRGDNELFGIVEDVHAGSRMQVSCEDGKQRLARICGSRRRRMGRIRRSDLVLVVPWSIQDEKADIVWRYRKNKARLLSSRGLLPDSVDPY